MDGLRKGAAERDVEVDDLYIGVVGANVSCNLKAMRFVEKEYPRLITSGCNVHCLDLLIGGIAMLHEVKAVMDNAFDLVGCIKCQKYLRYAFDQARADSLTPGQKLFPDTRFGYAPLTLESVMKNRRTFNEVRFTSEWEDVVKKLCPGTQQKLKKLLRDVAHWERFSILLELLSPIFRALHHLA